MPKTITIALKAEIILNDGEQEITVTMDYDALAEHVASCNAVLEAMGLTQGEDE